jgi:multiple sugar transport system permease protein
MVPEVLLDHLMTPAQRHPLAGVIGILLFLRFIWTFQTFEGVFLLPRGAGGTEVISVQLYNYLTARNDVGGAAALGLVLASVLVLAFFVYYRWQLRHEREVTE